MARTWTLAAGFVLAVGVRLPATDFSYPTNDGVAAPSQPNYFVEEPSGAEPLASHPAPPVEGDIRPHDDFQYPAQTAALLESDESAPREISPVADVRSPLPLSPPSSEPAKESPLSLKQPLVSGAASLGIVLGLFLLVVLVVRRGMPKGATALPKDVVEVLGRAPLVGRQQVHLVRCANKVLLVCVSPSSAQTLTEITDPHEVEQLLLVCRGSAGDAAFGRILEQYGQPAAATAQERRLAQDEAPRIDFSHLEALQHAGRQARTY